MRIAIIGSGISGLTAAYLLHAEHAVTIYEANHYVGGHAHTVEIELSDGRFSVDTGFLVFNDWTYPNFIALLDELDVASVATSMGFSVKCDRTGIEYSGSGLNGLFAQRRNLMRPTIYRLVSDIVRFNKQAPEFRNIAADVTVGNFLRDHRYSNQFAELYLLPMGAAIWSCPMETFENFPIRFIIEFYINHGLLQLTGRPVWRTIQGGSQNYVRKMTQRFTDSIRLETPIRGVSRSEECVHVTTQTGTDEFDEVIFACHSDQALSLLTDPSPAEVDVLSKFPYSKNIATLHTDETVLPTRKRAWAAWNYHVRRESDQRPTVTYNLNILQHLKTRETVCVSLNEEGIDPKRIHGTFHYSHPVFTTERDAAQARHQELIRNQRTSYCGAYWGNGFHEDGVNSALAVCRAFGVLPGWKKRTCDLVGENVGGIV